jgi:phosphatidylglycerol lysyltransferase
MYFRLKRSLNLASILVAAAGMTTLAQVLTVHIRHHRYGRIDDSLLPFSTAQSSRLLIVSVGILLLYLSVQIYRRKRLAFQLVSAGLILLIAVEILAYRDFVQLVFYGITLGLLVVTRRQYTVASNNLSLRRGALAAALIISVVFIYATIGFAELGNYETGTDIGIPTAMKFAAREVFTFQESQLALPSRQAHWFVNSVNAAAAIAYTLAIVSLFRPLQFRYGASWRDRETARRILAKHSTTTEDFFKLWPDKHYFFSPDKDSFVAYVVVGRDALVLGGPSGVSKNFKRLLQEFTAFSERSGWAAAYINISEDLKPYIDTKVYRRLFIGNEAVLDTALFAAQTCRSKHFRYIKNRAVRDGLDFEYWTQPLEPAQVAELRKISNAWLSQGSRREYSFALGYFDDEYIASCDAAILRHDGRVIAYANILPGFNPRVGSIDHMRHGADIPPTGMHFLLMQLILHLHQTGVQEFNLGLAPLSGIESRTMTSVPERLLGALKKLGGNYYSFGGLEQFKNKFEPAWQPRYIYYQGSPARLVRLAGSLSQAAGVPVAGRVRRLTAVAMAVLAAICYSSFPLAYLLNPSRAIDGLASELGASGQRYAGLFNGLDVASSLLLLGVVWLIWDKLPSSDRRARVALMLLAVSAIGTMLAAVTPLPAQLNTIAQIELHDFFSVVSVTGIIGSALALYTFAKHRWAIIPFLVLFLLSLLASVVLKNSQAGSAAQRCMIILMGIWMVVISAVLAWHSKQSGRTVED